MPDTDCPLCGGIVRGDRVVVVDERLRWGEDVTESECACGAIDGQVHASDCTAATGGIDVDRLARALLLCVPGYQRWLTYPRTPTTDEMEARIDAMNTEVRSHAERIARHYGALVR
jgi:hypothetical protein